MLTQADCYSLASGAMGKSPHARQKHGGRLSVRWLRACVFSRVSSLTRRELHRRRGGDEFLLTRDAWRRPCASDCPRLQRSQFLLAGLPWVLQDCCMRGLWFHYRTYARMVPSVHLARSQGPDRDVRKHTLEAPTRMCDRRGRRVANCNPANFWRSKSSERIR